MLSRCRCSSSAVLPTLPWTAYILVSPLPRRRRPNSQRYISSAIPNHSSKTPGPSNPVFSSTTSPWDQVFRDVDSYASPSNLYTSMDTNRSPRPRRARQSMTARESRVLNDMFEMIFDAASAQEIASSSVTDGDSAIGVGRKGIDDLIGKLRRYPKRLIQSAELNNEVDRQKEKIDLFSTDRELLEWVQDSLFEESRRYEAAAREAISRGVQNGVYDKLPMLQPSAYPHLLAHVMRTFRDKFDDPHLTLSMFEHARRLSIASYVFGCSSEAYHELIETQWKCFQDLRGVRDALVEMKVNGVKIDPRTRQLVEKIRKQVGEQQIEAEGAEIGSGDIWNILLEIERLVVSENAFADQGPEKKDNKSKKWNSWKTESLEDTEGDGWGFGRWDRSDSELSNRESKPKKRLSFT